MLRWKPGVREAWEFAARKALGRACGVCGGQNDHAALTPTCPACLVWSSGERVSAILRHRIARRVAG